MGGTEPLSKALPPNQTQYSTFASQSPTSSTASSPHASDATQRLPQDLTTVRSTTQRPSETSNFIATFANRLFPPRVAPICTPTSPPSAIQAARARGAAALAKLPPVACQSVHTALAPAVAPPVSRLADLPNVANADERYSAWIKLLYDEASTTARMTPRQLSPFADALDDLHERHRPFAAEFLIVFLRDFYVSNKPGELATYVGEVFDAMKRPACATALVRGFFDCTATVFGDKQHLVATGILTHLDRRMQSDADRLWRATAIWSLGFMRPEQRYDAWESAFTRLRHRLSTACVADIGLHASAIGLIPAGDQQQRAAGQLVRFIVMSLKRLDARDARMTFVCDALSAISDKAVRADIAERLMERASADNSASRDEVTRVISERLDMFDPGTGFHFLSLLSRTGKSAQSEKS